MQQWPRLSTQLGSQPVSSPDVAPQGWLPRACHLGGAVGLVLGALRPPLAFPDQGQVARCPRQGVCQVSQWWGRQRTRSGETEAGWGGRHALGSPHGRGPLGSPQGVALSSLGSQGVIMLG